MYAGSSGTYFNIGDRQSLTMSSYAFGFVESTEGWMFIFGGGNEVTMGPNFMEYTIHPVINVKGDATFALEGTGEPGSSINPYIIKTN